MPNPPVLRGYRRELTKEIFEDLAALQCEPSEILGYIGTTRQKLEAWCRKAYRRPLPEVLEAVRQDGLIQIRRASLEQLKKSATLIQQQYNRFLSAPAGQAEKHAESLAKQIFSIADPSEEEVRDLFE